VDITDEAAVRKAVADVERELGAIAVMVNSAGIVGPTSTKLSITRWKNSIRSIPSIFAARSS